MGHDSGIAEAFLGLEGFRVIDVHRDEEGVTVRIETTRSGVSRRWAPRQRWYGG